MYQVKVCGSVGLLQGFLRICNNNGYEIISMTESRGIYTILYRE